MSSPQEALINKGEVGQNTFGKFIIKDIINKAQAKGLRLRCLPPSFPSLSLLPLSFFQIGFLNLEFSNSCRLVSQQPQGSFYLCSPMGLQVQAGFTLLPLGAVWITELRSSRLHSVLAGFTSP